MKKLLNLWKRYSYLVLMAFVILGLFDPRIALAAIACMLAPIIVSMFKGRYWCGNLCPRGSFYDSVMARISSHKKAPRFLKSGLFRIAVFTFMMSMFALGVYKNWGNLSGIGMVFYRMIVVTTIIGIVLSLFYNQRAWCHFCPMGTAASVISGLRKSKKVLYISSSCVSCKKCEKKCPLGIRPKEYKGKVLSHPDCIQCGKCVEVCPKAAIGYHKNVITESFYQKDECDGKVG